MSKTLEIQGRGFAIFVNGGRAQNGSGIPLKRLQGAPISSNLGTTNILEMANGGIVEKKGDLPKTDVSLDMNEIGAFGNIAMITGHAYVNSGLFSVTDSDITFSGTNVASHSVADKMVDFIVKVSENNNTVVDRTLHMQGQYWGSMDGSYDVGGDAKQSFKFAGDMKKWYKGDVANPEKVDVYVAKCVPNAGAVTATVPVTVGTNVKRYLYVDHTEYAAADFNWVGTTATITKAGVANFTGTEHVTVVFHPATAAVFPALSSANTGTLGGLRRGNIVVELYSTNEAMALRCQSAKWSINFNQRVKLQLGTQRETGRKTAFPVDIKVDMTFDASDLEVLAELANKSLVTMTELDIKELLASSLTEATAKVLVYGDETLHDVTTLYETYTFTKMRLSSENDDLKVGANAAQWSCSMVGNQMTLASTGICVE